MYKLRTVEIVGFRGGAKSIKLELNSRANFIIGRNGTGKTTLINIIHSALSVDVAALIAAPFEVLTLKFKKDKDNRIPTVSVRKRIDESSRPAIQFSIQMSGKDDVRIFELNAPVRKQHYLGDIFSRPEITSDTATYLKSTLSNLYKLTWLSLQRSKAREIETPLLTTEDAQLSDVDRRMNHVVNDLVKYFVRLDKKVSDRTQAFQKDWFLSSLATVRNYSSTSIYDITSHDDREALAAIFNRFGLKPHEYRKKIDSHFQITQDAVERLKSQSPGRALDYMAAFDALRLHAHVEKWQTLEQSQKEIYSPQTVFLKIVSDMLYRKEIGVNRSNQIVVQSDDGLGIPLTELSSGEKQLIIFLSETLLQEREPFIFMADEPELSLHVQWQEELVPNILTMNPNAQILFATHSPDIVNVYRQNIIKMEELIN